jgi:hypothetical protein
VAVPRFNLLLGTALIAVAGCAHQQPMRADHTSPTAISAAPAASPSTVASLQAMKSAVPPRLLVFAHDQGYRDVVIKGKEYYFCKTEDPMGSIIPVRQCVNQSQLEFLQQQLAQQQQQLTRRAPEAHNSSGP